MLVMVGPGRQRDTVAAVCASSCSTAGAFMALLALLDEVAHQVRARAEVAGSAQMVARLERCREVLVAPFEGEA